MRMRKNLAAKIGGFLLASLIAGTSLPAFAANDCDLDNDHITDATSGGNDKDLDNDNGTDQDNDHSTDKYNVGAPPHAKR